MNKLAHFNRMFKIVIKLILILLLLVVLIAFFVGFFAFFANMNILSKFFSVVLIAMLSFGIAGLMSRMQWGV